VSAFRNDLQHVVQHNGDVADAGGIKQADHVVPLVELEHALIEALRARAPRPVSGASWPKIPACSRAPCNATPPGYMKPACRPWLAEGVALLDRRAATVQDH
jgi:hypothetical protein